MTLWSAFVIECILSPCDKLHVNPLKQQRQQTHCCHYGQTTYYIQYFKWLASNLGIHEAEVGGYQDEFEASLGYTERS